MNTKLVYVVILGYNHLQDLTETIDSFYGQDFPQLKIILSDNNSVDESVSFVKEHYPEVIIIENQTNLGWAGGNNQAIRYALANNADYIILSNNDITIDDPHLISEMTSDMEYLKEEKIFLLGTTVNLYSSKQKTHNHGLFIYPKQDKNGNSFNTHRTNYRLTLEDKYELVDSPAGCFFMINSTLFREIGLLNEKMFMYADEVEFALRAWKIGYKSAINRDLTIYHKIGTSSVPQSPFSNYYRSRNLLYLIKKFNPRLRFFLLYLKGLIRQTYYILSSKGGKGLKQKLKKVIAIYIGAMDGLFNNFPMRYQPSSNK